MNVGGLSFTYGLETDDTVGTSYVFNAHDAAWITFCRGIFDACQSMYRNRESAGCFNATNYLKKVKAWQDARPERVWVADAQRKYLRPYEDNGTITYIPMEVGRKTHQREQVVRYNQYYYASKYVSDFCTSQNIMVRGNTPTVWHGVAPANTATLAMYIDCYIVVASTSYNVVAKTKAKRGQSYVMDFSTIGSMGETELYFCTAPMITELSGLAHLYFKQNNFGMGTNLQRLEVGSNVEGYENPNLEGLTIGNNRMLEYLDVRNCPNATGALDLSGCLSLREIYLDNTAFTGITFATGGLLETAHLPYPTSLTMRELIYLDTLQLAGTNALATLRVEDCTFDDNTKLIIGDTTTTQSSKDIVLNLVDSSPNLSRARLLGIDWLIGDTTTLNRLLAMAGIGDDSYNISQSVLTGDVYINGAVRIREINSYRDTWEYLTVDYNPNNIVEQYVATYVNYDGTTLYTAYVDRGSVPPDPVEEGLISTPTKTSDEQYDYTFSGWDDITSAMLGNRTITAEYSSSIRTYTITWYAREGVPLRTTRAEYGSEVVYDGDLPTRTDGESSYTYYIFTGWDKSTGFITGDTAVYANWETSGLPSTSTDLNDMTFSEIYGLATASNIDINNYLEAKDYKDITVGNDFSFTNVESTVLCQNVWFDGTNHLDTNIKLFDESANSFTLAMDFEFYGTTAGDTLVSCFEEDGSEGFRLRYSNGPNIQWGDKNERVGYTTKRGMCVIRHQKGSNRLYVYASNLSEQTLDDTILVTQLNRTRETSSEIPLTFGAVKFPDGGYDFFAKGWIHWCKIWYQDLGDANARELAAWPHETWRMEYTAGTNRYRIPGTSRYAKLSFIMNQLLDYGHLINNSYSNVGGWPASNLHTVLNDRIYNALPIPLRSILKTVRVNSSAGGRSTEIVFAEDCIYIPSATELNNNQSSPYVEEGKHISWFTLDNTRIKYRGLIVPDGSTVYTISEDPTISNTVNQGDQWYYNGSYYYYVSADNASKHHYVEISGSNLDANNGGKWIRSTEYWTRSPHIDYDTNFIYISATGYPYFPNSPTVEYGLDICFSI